jgi:hypothetical protein
VLATLLSDSDEDLDHLLEEGRGLALCSGDWKFVESNLVKNEKTGKRNVKLPASLFDLSTNTIVGKNLIPEQPAKAREMKALLRPRSPSQPALNNRPGLDGFLFPSNL